MFTKRFPIFTLFGFSVAIDLTWLILAVLISWSLAVGLFPALYPGLGEGAYWTMGVLGALGLFFSIVVHELSHSLVGKAYGMPIKGITLFLFGGVAEMHDEPSSPKAEFWTAIVGPITSFALAIAFYGLAMGAEVFGGPITLAGLLGYLAALNVILAVFNLVPAFPLDGGRVLRAGLWAWKGSFLRATRIASLFGSGFGLVLIVLAVISVVNGDFIAGMWWFLIGLFIRGAAQASYQQTLVRQTLQGVAVSRLMTEEPVTVRPSLSLDDLVGDFFYKHHFKTFPVVGESGALLGCANLCDVKDVPRHKWPESRVADILQASSKENTVDPETDAGTVLNHMLRAGVPRLMVSRNRELLGIVSQSDILRFLAIKLNLESEEADTVGRTLESTRARLARESR